MAWPFLHETHLGRNYLPSSLSTRGPRRHYPLEQLGVLSARDGYQISSLAEDRYTGFQGTTQMGQTTYHILGQSFSGDSSDIVNRQ